MASQVQGRPHVWQSPPPGQSPVDVCRECGERRIPPYDQTACEPDVVGASLHQLRTLHDYSPI